MAVPKVLVVDRDYESCFYVSDLLVDSGFCVDVAGDAQTALQKCNSHDVLLIESSLPDMGGMELFRRAKGLRANIRAVLMTTVRSYEELQAAIDAGMWDVLAKPLNTNRLVRTIREVAGETG